MAWTTDDYNAGKLKTDNFKWGTAGVGKEGVDWGNTSGWGAQQWVDWNNQYNPQQQQTIDNGPVENGGTGSQPNDSWGTPGVAGGPPGGNYKSSLKEQLYSRANQSMDIDPNNPVMKAQMDAFNAQQDRATNQAMSQAAEEAAARGLGNSGALENEKRLAQERAGFNSAQFQGQLMQQELTSRREEVQNALEQMGNILSDEEKLALTKEMHDIDSAIERTKTENQNSQYYAGLSSQERIAANRLAQEWVLGQQGFDIDWARLAQGDQQFADALGFRLGDRQPYYDTIRGGL